MLFGRCLFIAILCLTLLSCASERHLQDQEIAAGRSSFENGYYKDAFCQLLPLAAKGRPEAEYAVGYMYYYGYGVPQDTASGVFWINKAAEQQYPPAITAMGMIHQHQIEEVKKIESRQHDPDIRASIQPVSPPIVVKQRRLKKVSMMEPAHEQPKPKLKPVQSVAENNTPEEVSPKFTLQLYGSYKLTHVKHLQAQLRLKNTGHIFQTSHEGKDWYVLTFGNFVTAHEASATKNNLPKNLKELTPWVRKVDTLKRVVVL